MKLSFSVAVLALFLAQALAVMPSAPIRSRQVVKMSAQQTKQVDIVKAGKAALAGLTPIIAANPVFATEGTGEVRASLSCSLVVCLMLF